MSPRVLDCWGYYQRPTYVITNTWPISKVSFLLFSFQRQATEGFAQRQDKTKRVTNKLREVIMAAAQCRPLGLKIDKQCTFGRYVCGCLFVCFFSLCFARSFKTCIGYFFLT